MAVPARELGPKHRFARRRAALRDFLWFAMWSGAYVASLEGANVASLVESLEPLIRGALRSQSWTKGKRPLKISASNVKAVRPHITRWVSEVAIIQLDILVHQTFNDIRGRRDNDVWFEIDFLPLLDDVQATTGRPWLVANVERCRDLVMLALLRNMLVHRQDGALPTQDEAPSSNGLDRARLKSFSAALFKCLQKTPDRTFTWKRLDSDPVTIASDLDVARWYEGEIAYIYATLAYDDYFRFSWAAKTVLNAVLNATSGDNARPQAKGRVRESNKRVPKKRTPRKGR